MATYNPSPKPTPPTAYRGLGGEFEGRAGESLSPEPSPQPASHLYDMKIALIGQPNCGKSTIFNYFSGYKAAVSNFPGTTVKFTVSQVVFEGEELTCVDLPGVYSLTSTDQAELESRNYLLAGESEVIINVIDASLLGRSLELTLELMSLERPLVVALNMMDEAVRKGIDIDAARLSELLGVPVVPTIAAAGRGLSKLLRAALSAGRAGVRPVQTLFSRDIEEEIDALADQLDFRLSQKLGLPWRFMLVKALEDDPHILEEIRRRDGQAIPWVKNSQKILAQSHGRPPETVISSERHALTVNIFEQVARVKPAEKPDWRDRLDRIATHRFWGYVVLVAVLSLFFQVVFRFGQYAENFLMGYLALAQKLGQNWLGTQTLAYTVAEGLLMGIFGGVAIVLPYLTPFLVGLALLEDSGYLPRVAFLMDNLMHLMGLHGKSIIPFILGYGCSVPSVMSTRILESPRDRLVVSMLAVLIPCSARSVIIFALVAYALGPYWALGVYFFQSAGHRHFGPNLHLDPAGGLPGAAHGDPRVPPAHLEQRGPQVLAQLEGVHRGGLAHSHRRQPGAEPAEVFTAWRPTSMRPAPLHRPAGPAGGGGGHPDFRHHAQGTVPHHAHRGPGHHPDHHGAHPSPNCSPSPSSSCSTSPAPPPSRP